MGGEDRKMLRSGELNVLLRMTHYPFSIKTVFLYFYKILPLVLCWIPWEENSKALLISLVLERQHLSTHALETMMPSSCSCLHVFYGRGTGAEVYQGPSPSLGEEVQGQTIMISIQSSDVEPATLHLMTQSRRKTDRILQFSLIYFCIAPGRPQSHAYIREVLYH